MIWEGISHNSMGRAMFGRLLALLLAEAAGFVPVLCLGWSCEPLRVHVPK